MTTGKMHSAKRKKFITNSAVHVILGVLAVIWVFPIIWVILTSFRAEKGSYVSTFLPQSYSLDNYIKLFTDTSILNFPQMFMNTLFIAVCSCILATFYVLAVSYCLSRLRFKLRKPYMNMAMILGLFPGLHVHGRSVLHPEGSRPVRRKPDQACADPRIFRRRGTELPDRKGILRYDPLLH